MAEERSEEASTQASRESSENSSHQSSPRPGEKQAPGAALGLPRGNATQRLNYLFDTVRQADGSEYPVSEVVRWVNAHVGSTSRARVTAIRKGWGADDVPPGSDELAKLAEFFYAEADFFTAAEPAPIDGPLHARLIQQRLQSYRRGTIPQRVYYLFTTVVHADGRPHRAIDVARWVNANGGKITNVYIQKLISGERGKTPNTYYLQWIGKYFGVGVSFFYDEDPPELDGEYHNAIIMLRNRGSAELLQVYGQLTPAQREAVRQLTLALARDNDPTFTEPGSDRPAHDDNAESDATSQPPSS